MPEKILILDDDAKLSRLLVDYFAKNGLNASAEASPEAALRRIKRESPDLLILDVMLPGRDGFSVLKELRRDSALPVIMLTARGEVTDRVVGLELGADDYLPKPFEPRELLARVTSVLRRGRPSADARTVLHFDDLSLDFGRRSAELSGRDLELSSMEFELLGLLAQSAGHVLSREKILDRLKGQDFEAFDRSIDVAISRLRQKLGDDPKKPLWIRTVYGEGYRFVGKHGS